MGSICKAQHQNEELNEVDLKKPTEKEKEGKKGGDTITIPNVSGSISVSSKKQQQEQAVEQQKESQEEQPAKSDANELKKRDERKKMAKIAAVGDNEEIFENITKKEKQKSPFDYQLILNALSTNFLFNQIQSSDKEQIVEKMFYCTVKDGDFVFKQGDKASSYFLIERGQCQIIINGDVKKTIKSSDAFGELALLYNAPRSASVKALGDCAFWGIDRNTFRKVIETISTRDYEENRKFIQNVKFFGILNLIQLLKDFLTEEQKDAISNVLITLVYKKGELIVNQGDLANSFFIIKSGQVSVIQGEKELRKMTQGESFGEQALFQNSTRGATVKAVDEEVRCLALSRDDITRILGDKIQVIMYNNTQKWALERNEILKKLTKIQIEKILLNCKNVQYQANDIVFKAKSQCQKLVTVLEGTLIEEGTNKIVAEKEQIYGVQFLRSEQKNDMQRSNNILILLQEFRIIQQ